MELLSYVLIVTLCSSISFFILLQVQTSEIYALRSNQEETDSRIVLYLHQAVKWGYKSCVVRTPDTDILMILLYHASKINLSIYLDHGSGKHRILINVTELSESLGPDYCSTLLGFYVFTGEDCTSAFKGKGKVNPWRSYSRILNSTMLSGSLVQTGWSQMSFNRRWRALHACMAKQDDISWCSTSQDAEKNGRCWQSPGLKVKSRPWMPATPKSLSHPSCTESQLQSCLL